MVVFVRLNVVFHLQYLINSLLIFLIDPAHSGTISNPISGTVIDKGRLCGESAWYFPTRCCRTLSSHPAASTTKAATFRRYPSYSGPLLLQFAGNDGFATLVVHNLEWIWTVDVAYAVICDYGPGISAYPKHESETIDRPTYRSHLGVFLRLCPFIPRCF